MARQGRALALVLATVTAASVAAFQAQQPALPPATLTGSVLTTEGKPPAGMSVVLFPADELHWASATPDEIRRATLTNGAYRLPNLPPGDYKVLPAADVSLREFPSETVLRRLAPLGLPVTLASGEQTRLSFTVSGTGADAMVVDANLARTVIEPGRGRLTGPGARIGAAASPGSISGRVVDAHGRPVVSAPVRAVRRVALRGGAPQPVSMGPGATTDANGQYRLTNLAPGSYFVAVLAFASPAGPGAPTRANVLPSAPARADGTTMGYTTTYFPGTPSIESAQMVTVGTNALTSIDLMLMPVPVADIAGRIVTPDGAPFGRGFVTMLPEAIDDHIGGQNVPRAALLPDGQFSFAQIPYGRYLVTVHGGPAGWVREVLDVRGPAEPMTLTLQRPFMVSGRIDMAGRGRGAATFDYSQLTVTLDPRPLLPGSVRLRATTSPDGTFTIPAVPRGTFALQATGRTPVSQLSGLMGGVDSLDLPVDIAADVSDALIVLGPRAAALLVTVRDDAGQPAAGATVALFSEDRTYWTAPSRRLQIVRAPAGSATLSEIPPGRYFVVAGYDLSPGPALATSWFEALLPRAIKVDVAAGADRTVQVTVTSR